MAGTSPAMTNVGSCNWTNVGSCKWTTLVRANGSGSGHARNLGQSSPQSKTQSGEVAMTMLRLVAFILAAAFTASAAQAEIKTEWIEYTHGDAKLKGYLAYDDSLTGKRPGVLMVHRRDGMT